jgi:hypothetical protein
MPKTNKHIYLDFNASTALAPEVAAAMRAVLEEPFGNPSSTHWAGVPAREAVEKALLGIRVNRTSPSTIDAPAARKVIAEGKAKMEDLPGKALIKRFINPEKVAKLAAYLCSSAAACVTSANWVVDCGYTAH